MSADTTDRLCSGMLGVMSRMLAFMLLGALLGGCASTGGGAAATGGAGSNDAQDVWAVLDSLHDAAARADGAKYFSLYAPEAVFLGTDETERWTLKQFRAYAEPIFAKGRGWTYTRLERSIVVQPGGWASFDELLENAKYGVCRGSGSLRRTGEGWKIVQYNLSVPIPNDLLERTAGEIRAFKARPPHPTPPPPSSSAGSR